MERPYTAEVKINSWVLPAVVAALLLMQWLNSYRVWLLLLVGLGGALLLSYLWARSLSRNLSFVREVRYGWAKVGDQLLERFNIENRGRLDALFLTVSDHSDMPGYQGDRVTTVDRGAVKSWMKRSICSIRGLYTVGPTTLETGDPFGVFNVKLHFPASHSMLVLPPVVNLPAIEIAPGERIGDGRLQSFSLERTVSSSSLREYAPGDSMRAIHWPQSARRDELVVRLFDSAHFSDWWIILDMDENTQMGQDEKSTEELGVVLAASLADRGHQLGRSIGLVTQGRKFTWLPPRLGNAQYWEIMRALALAKPAEGSLAYLLARAQAALGQRTSVVIITASVDAAWMQSIVTLMRRSVAVTVLLMDPLAFGGGPSAAATIARLRSWGVTAYRITPDFVSLPGMQEEDQEQEELTTTLTALRKRPALNVRRSDFGWKELQ
jgi:uncharacterized protein (DUF58 family)